MIFAAALKKLTANRRVRPAALLAGVLGTLVLSGCEKPPSAHLDPIAPAAEQAASPEAAARAVLECIQAELKAVAAEDREQVRGCRARLLGLAAADRIEEAFEKDPIYRMVIGTDVMKGFTESWGATISRYAPGLRLEQMTRDTAHSKPDDVTLIVPADVGDDSARISVRCVAIKDGTWRVWRIEFADAGAPATATTSAPSSPTVPQTP